MYDLETTRFLLATKWNPTDIDIENIDRLLIIIKQLDKLWN